MSSENNLENELNDVVDETIKEPIDETISEAGGAVDDAAEAAEAAEGTAEKAADEAAEEVKEAAEAAAAPIKQVKAAPVIKKKKGINKTTLIVLIVCAVIVLACVWFVGFKLGWWHVPTKANYTIAPHETIEISKSDVEVSDDTIESYVTRFQDAYATTEEVTTGKVEEGDTVYISYVGTIDGEEFEGGTSDGYELTIGSGNFIDGFEDGLVGVNVGDTVDLDLTFPEDYSSEEVAGKDVTFEVTVIHKDVKNTPEFTDEFVKENSAEYTETTFEESTQLDTTDAYRDYIYDYLHTLYIDSALENKFDELIDVKTYDEADYNLLYDYGMESLEYYASYYGVDKDTLASYYGYEDSESYNKDTTEQQLRLAMLYSDLAAEIGVTHTDEEVDAAIEDYMEENGVSESYTLDEFKEINGEAWLYMFRNYEMNYDPVIEAMRDRVVLVDDVEEETVEEETSSSN